MKPFNSSLSLAPKSPPTAALDAEPAHARLPLMRRVLAECHAECHADERHHRDAGERLDVWLGQEVVEHVAHLPAFVAQAGLPQRG